MIIYTKFRNKEYSVDLKNAMDISRPLSNTEENVLAFGVEKPSFVPLGGDGWELSVKNGGGCNCDVITFMPHCHGTHTECIGHITPEQQKINQQLKDFHFFCQVSSFRPTLSSKGQFSINRSQIEAVLNVNEIDSFVIRCLPNEDDKASFKYSGTEPVFLEPEATAFLAENGIKHLLLDVPSVDPEFDEGKLAAHKAYWYLNGKPRLDATITELIFVPSRIQDGNYLLNLQIASFENDASPSKPVLYMLNEI